MYVSVALYVAFAVFVYQLARLEHVGVSYFKADFFFMIFCPRVVGDEVEVHQSEFAAVLLLGVIAM